MLVIHYDSLFSKVNAACGRSKGMVKRISPDIDEVTCKRCLQAVAAKTPMKSEKGAEDCLREMETEAMREVPLPPGETVYLNNKGELLPEDSKYYDVGGISTIDVIRAKLTKKEYRGWLKGNVIKYSTRMSFKGAEAKDAAKLSDYAMWLGESYYQEE